MPNPEAGSREPEGGRLPRQGEVQELARAVAGVGLVLCLVYLLQVVAELLPLRLLDPLWQRRVALALTQNAALALIGCVLVQLAWSLDPSHRRLRRWRGRLRGWAALASLGFLLLLPLEAWLALQPASSPAPVASEPEQRVLARFEAMRQAIRTADSADALRGNLARLQAPPLAERQRLLPLPRLKQQLLEVLERSQPYVLERVDRQVRARRRAVRLLDSGRRMLASLFYAIGFALVAEWPRGGMARGVARLPAEDQAYFEALAQEAPQRRAPESKPPQGP